MNLPKKGLRTVFLVFVVLTVFTVYVLQLMRMQIKDGEKYKLMVDQGSESEQTVAAARGEIYDRYGTPLAINTTGYNVVLDKAFLPKGGQNQVILDLTRVLAEAGESWIDNLPLTREMPFRFLEDDPQSGETVYAQQVRRLKNDIQVQQSASVSDVLYWLVDRYGLEDFTPSEQRTIAGIRYEMERRGFNYETPYTFAENVSISTVSKVKELGYVLRGADVVESPIRQYVSGQIMPHIVGYTGPIYREEYEKLKAQNKDYKLNDTIGKAGVELQFEDTLRGKAGKRKITMNASGDVIDEVMEVEPVPGNTVILTIDSKLQQVTQNAMEAQIKNLNATAPSGEGKEAFAGAAVAIHCKTGEVLAAVTYPSYDMDTFRNNYSSLLVEERPLVNRAYQGTYAAGSCYKPSVAPAGLSEGIIKPDTTYYCGHVYTRFQGYQPTCMGFHQDINVLDALRYSCNIFFYELGFNLGIDKMNQYSAQLGLGQPTGLELPESIGQLSSPETKKKDDPGSEWTGGDVIQSAIGQLYNMFTPLQLANYAATLGNRGKRMEAHIIKSIESYNFDQTVFTSEPKVAQVVDAPPEAFETVVDGMVRVSRIGTATKMFGNYPINVAAKTGTPQTWEFPNSVFIAFAPAEDPELAVAVVIEKGWQGTTGAPVAKAVFDQYFYSGEQQATAPAYGELLP